MISRRMQRLSSLFGLRRNHLIGRHQKIPRREPQGLDGIPEGAGVRLLDNPTCSFTAIQFVASPGLRAKR
jgi:hypothetical protein